VPTGIDRSLDTDSSNPIISREEKMTKNLQLVEVVKMGFNLEEKRINLKRIKSDV
jgi:hypothetical protein